MQCCLQFAHYGDDLTEDLHVVWAEYHLAQLSVSGHQNHRTVPALQRLDGGLVTRNSGYHDFVVFSGLLATADNKVSVEDARLDHGITSYTQHEEFAAASEIFGHWDEFLDVALR